MKQSPISAPRRIGALRSRLPENTWVESRVAEAILQVGHDQCRRLAETGRLRRDTKKLYNLADILARYQQLLRTSGAIEQHVEATSYREFEAGRLPQEVVIEHAFSGEAVMAAWKNWNAMRADPIVAEQVHVRADGQRAEEAARCKDCLRTKAVRDADTLRIIREVTGDPVRETLNIAEDRAFAELDVRCLSCRTIKATAPVETMRARWRKLMILGEPKPIVLPPLPPNDPPPTT